MGLVTALGGLKHFALKGAGLESSQGAVAIVAVCLPLLSSPDGSYTEEQSQESEVKVLATDFDDEFDDEEPLPAIGTCKALYTFEGNTRASPRPPLFINFLCHSSLSRITPSFEAFQIFLCYSLALRIVLLSFGRRLSVLPSGLCSLTPSNELNYSRWQGVMTISPCVQFSQSPCPVKPLKGWDGGGMLWHLPWTHILQGAACRISQRRGRE